MDTSLKNTFDSIIFDLDGTLWDSTANVALAWQHALNQVDYLNEDMTVERVRSITGMTYDAIFDKLFPALSDEQRKEVQALCAVSELEILHKKGGELYPELEETLKYLGAKYKLYIVSNCQNGYIEVFLDLNNMHPYFLAHQCFGTKGNPKADNIKDIVNDHRLQAPVYVGDTMGDYTSATKAGVPFIFASYGFGVVPGGMVATVDNFAELTELL
ncbi:HAD family hydrolase [Mucilaginibacter sp. OK283]|jgi:phosphoglycolate phosphatase|uniref:HAD family hydrolase n=1 Tax=Mucilaginibacter sp. OK283 TaxID=1881049 RepID=UPI0008AAA4EA|nr:HAD family hydrolase [Mucilaginibacter sp. OK283]SEP45864.1 phosphoglycolate phosphatase [Mucilaginibacter sp. OK283]